MILHPPLRRALVTLALYLSASMMLNALRQRHLVGDEAFVRLMGMLIGTVVLAAGNTLPKQLVPLARLSCAPARDQTLRRLCGWAMVLGGLGYALAFAFAPIGTARPLGNCFLTPAALVVAGVMVRCVWAHASGRRSGV